MDEVKHAIIVGVLGQWASGKSTAARTLIRRLGGEDQVIFITDRELYTKQAINHVRYPQGYQVTVTVEEDGTRRLAGEMATIWLKLGEELETADYNTVRFMACDEITPLWLDRARIELGHEIREQAAEGKPIVIEAGFGANPPDHTLSDLFRRLDEAGVEPGQVKWLLVETCFEKRTERNAKRQDRVPADTFAKFAADGGCLDLNQWRQLEARGTTIKRIHNDHDDVERFQADVIAVFEEVFEDLLGERSVAV